MAFDPGVIPEDLQGVFLNDPYLPSFDRDVDMLGLINMSSNMGYGSPQKTIDPIRQSFEEFKAEAPSGTALATPTFFDYERSGVERYLSNERDFSTLGYNPLLGEKNEYKYARLQTWGDVLSNGFAGMFKLAGNAFVEGWKGWGNLADAVASTSWDEFKTDLMGTPEELLEQDKTTKAIMNKYAIYNLPEYEKSAFNRKFFGDMLQQSGFAFGTIAQFLSEELLTWGLSTEFSLAKLGISAPKWAGRIISKADIAKDMTKLGMPIWEAKSIPEFLVTGARKMIPFADTGYTLAKYGKAGAGTLQMAAIGVGGVRRFLSEANMAMTEARMESAGTYGELYNKLYDEELFKTGEAPSADKLANIEQLAKDAAYDNFKVNTGILMLSNRLQFDNLFSKFSFGRKALSEGTSEFAEDILKVSGKKIVSKGVTEPLTKIYEKGTFGTFGLLGKISKDFGKRAAAWEATKSLGRNIFKWEASEGLQELFQEGSNKGLVDYYYDLYHGKKGYDSRMQAIMENIDNPLTNVQGLKTFLMGALTGRLLSPINFAIGKAKERIATSPLDRLARQKRLTESVQAVNGFYENPNKYLPEHIANVKVQNKAAQNMQEAIANKDAYVFNNNKDSAFAKMISAAIKTDMIDSVLETLRGYGEAFNDTEFKEAFGFDKTEENIASTKDFFNKIADNVVDSHKRWKSLKNQFGDLVIPELYKEGTPERKIALRAKRALDDAIEMLATLDHKARRATVRAGELQVKMSELPVLGSTVATAFRNIGVIQNTEKEIELLTTEIKNLEAQEKKDKATIDLIESKKDQLESLQKWKENYAELANMERGDKLKIDTAKKALVSYLNSKNKESNIDVVIKEDQLDEIYRNLLDYIELNKDNKDYIDAYNKLANPINFVKVHERLIDAMEEVEKQKNAEHIVDAIKQANGIKDNQELQNHTVVQQTDGKFSVISPKGNTVGKDLSEAEANTIAKELDEVLKKEKPEQKPPVQGGEKDEEKEPKLDKGATIKEKARGIFLIEQESAETGTFDYYILDKNGNPVEDVELDPENFPEYQNNILYESYSEAKRIFDALVDKATKDAGEYQFDGKTIKAGTILLNDRSRRYIVLTKGGPIKKNKIPTIIIAPVDNLSSTDDIQSLKGYRLESETEVKSEVENPNAFRLKRNNELLKVYPHKLDNESRDSAKERLAKLILETPASALASGISFLIVKNQQSKEPRIAQDANGQNQNERLKIYPEPYMIQIQYQGKPIGYFPYYNTYKYVDTLGRETDMKNISITQFQEIFDVENKDLNKEYGFFKDNYEKSSKIYSILMNELPSPEAERHYIDTERALKLFEISSYLGQYDYLNESDTKPTLNDLKYKTVNGKVYIIDRRQRYLGNGMFEDDPRVITNATLEEEDIIEKRVNEGRYDEYGKDRLQNMGRYVAAVELPNGTIRFVELSSAKIDKDVLNDIVDKINKKSAELKDENLVEKTDAITKQPYLGSKNPLAGEDVTKLMDDTFYITSKSKGIRISIAVMPNGNLKVEFAYFQKNKKNPLKTQVFLKESDTNDRQPFKIKDIYDLLERINRAIEKHDKDNSTVDPFKNSSLLRKIGVKLTVDNFKANIPKNADVDVFNGMLAGTGTSVIKKDELSFSINPSSANKDSNPTDPKLTARVESSKKDPKKKPPTTETVNFDDIDITDDDISQSDKDVIAKKLAEAKRKKQEEAEKLKQTASNPKPINVAEELSKIEDERKRLSDIIAKEIRDKAASEGRTIKTAEVNKLVAEAYFGRNKDPRIITLDQRKALLIKDAGGAKKIAANLSEADVVDINEFTKWVKENLPEFISIEDLKVMNTNMKKDGVTVGMFYMHMNQLRNRLEGKIAVKRKSAYKYHEAFHAIFRMLLTNEKIEQLVNIAKSELKAQGKNIETLKKELLESNYTFYSQFSDKELEERVYEEYLADRFDAWKSNIKTPTSPVNKGFFRWLLDFIKNFFKSLKRTQTLEDFFMKVEKGKYKNSQIVLNKFTEGPIISVTQPALKSIKIGVTYITNEDGEVEEVPRYLSQEEGEILASTVAAVFNKRMMEAGYRDFDEDVLDGVIANFANLYDRNLNPYYDSDEFAEKYDPVEYIEILQKIDDKKFIFTNPELIKILKESVMVHIKIMGYGEQIDEDELDRQVNEYGDRATTDNKKEAYSIGGYGSLSRELRLYLGTIVEEKADEFGNTRFIDDDGKLMDEKIIEAANANVLYNGILKAVAGSSTEEEILQKLKIFAKYNPEANKFWNKFSTDVGLIEDEEGNFVDISNKKQANLFQAVVKGFSQYAISYLFMNKDIKNKTVKIIEANKRGAAKNQFSIWYNTYLRSVVQEYHKVGDDSESIKKFFESKTKYLSRLGTLLSKSSFYNNMQKLDDDITMIVREIRENLGISLSPLFIKYSYLSKLDETFFDTPEKQKLYQIVSLYQNVKPMTSEDALEIVSVIKSGKNPFGDNLDPNKINEIEKLLNPKASHEEVEPSVDSGINEVDQEEDINDDLAGAKGRLLSIAESNAVFDEQVSTTSYKNANGEMVFGHQLPTFDLVRATELRSSDFRDKLKKDKFLKNHYLLNNPYFQAIANNFQIIRSDGIKDSSLTKKDDGTLVEDKRLNVNQNKGVTYGQMSPREFMITLIELYGKNKTYSVLNSETGKKESFTTSVNLLGVIESKNTGDFAELPIIKAVEIIKGKIVLTSEAENALFNEVMREYDRIARVQKEITEKIYPEGIIEGYHNGDPEKGGLRGLKFIKTGRMLGDLRESMEEAAKQGIELTADEKSTILNQIQEYWVGENNSALTEFIDTLIKENIIKKDSKGNLQNNLLSSFAFRGFTKDGKINEVANFNTNLVATNPAFNLAQILVNNFINTLSVRQLFIGDAAENFKDDGGIDEVKRNAGLNAIGASAYSTITAPELGINHANKKSHVVTYEDAQYDGKFKGKKDSKEDAQTRMTVKALRYMLFGFGKLNQAQAELLDKIEKGEDVDVADVFGETYEDEYGITRRKAGSIKYNAQTNSLKVVYNDGKNYVKTSAFVLTKQLTSLKEGNEWVARPGYEDLHNLREKLEDFEDKNQTIAFAVPKSASKGLKVNMAKSMSAIEDNNFMEFDNRFWKLQQENPSNKKQITDPTQAKHIILSEQDDSLEVDFMGQKFDSDGKPWTIGKLKELYQSDVQQRVKNKYEAARDEIFDIEEGYKELGKSISQDKITPKLGNFLKRAVSILQTTGADPQLIEFFTPKFDEATGEYTPIYDLNHPITLNKFTQIFLSYFSRDVMNEKVPGDSVALVSNVGMKVVKRVKRLDENGQPIEWEVITRRQYETDRSLLKQIRSAKTWNSDLDRQFEGLEVGDYYIDDLRHNVPEFDANGNIIGYYTEYMMPPTNPEMMKEYLKTGKLTEDLLKAFGVRIPSQDKHSFVSLKLVDFLPAHYGSVGVFPHELIEISGADFDIDKLYMHMMDTYIKDGKRVAYGTAKTDEEKFAEYVYYMVKKNKAVKSKIKELRKITVNADEDTGDYYIDGELDPVTKYENIDDLLRDLLSSKVSVREIIEITALKELNLPATVKEYIEHVKTKGELNNGVLNNRILAAKIALLSNEHMVKSKDGKTPIAFQVAETKPLEDVIKSFEKRFPVLEDVLVEKTSDVDSLIGQYKAFKNNKEGARNIGPAVNSNLTFSFMNTFGIKLRKKNSKDEKLFVLNIDGHDFDSYAEARAWNNETKSYDGERKNYHISAIVSAMTDNAKERLAARLGLNINAIDVVCNMVALGVPLETAIMFNLQPSVREFYQKVNIAGNNIKTSEEQKIYKVKVGQEILNSLNSKRAKKEEDRILYPITTDLLQNNILSKGDNADVNFSIFSEFLEFYNQTAVFSSVATIMKLTQGLGTSNEDIDKVDEVEEKLGLNLSTVDFMKSNIPFDLRQVLRGIDKTKPYSKILSNYIDIKNQIKNLQKSIMIERSFLFKRIKEAISENLSVRNKESQTFKDELKNNLIAYLGIKAYMNYLKVNGKGVKLAGLDNALIYDAEAVQRGEDYEDIIDAVAAIRDLMPQNYFADFIDAVPVLLKDISENKMTLNLRAKGGINTIQTNTWAKLDTAVLNKIQDSFIDLYSNYKTRPYVYKLFNYLLVKDGGQFKSGSFIKFMPPALFKDLLDATGAAQNLLKYDNKINNDQAYKDVFGMTAIELFNEAVKLYSTNINNSFYIKIINHKATVSDKIKEPEKGYVSKALIYDQKAKTIKLDIFGGIREKELMLLTDEMGNEFYDEVIKKGKFSPEENDKFKYNIEMLKAQGFNITQRTNKEGKEDTFIELPYVIKINVGEYSELYGKKDEFIYFKLKRTAKSKEQKETASGLANFIIEPGDNLALSSSALYERFEPEGSKNQWHFGGTTGNMPTTLFLRDRYIRNKNKYDDIDLQDDLDYYDNQLAGIPDWRLEEPIVDLESYYGIFPEPIGNKFYFFVYEKGKKVPYDAKGAKTPAELLERLDRENNLTGKDRDEKKNPFLKSSGKPVENVISAKVEVISENYTPELLRANPNKLFLFGDNNIRTGKGGQAVIRDEPNAMGISTKLLPKNTDDAFMSDEQLIDNKAVIDSDIKKAKERATKEGKTIALPKGGFGTGLAALATKAPQTFAYLNQRLKEEFGFDNVTGALENKKIETSEFGDIDLSGQPDAEKTKNVLKDFVRKKKNLSEEIEQRKKQDDAGCGQG